MGSGSNGALFGSGFSLQTRKKNLNTQSRNPIILHLSSIFLDSAHLQFHSNISPVLDHMIQQRRYRWTLGRGLLIQKTPRAILAHHKLFKHRHESARCASSSKTSRLSPFTCAFPPEAFCQTSGFRCWRTSRRHEGPARPCGSHTCQLKWLHKRLFKSSHVENHRESAHHLNGAIVQLREVIIVQCFQTSIRNNNICTDSITQLI